MRLLLQAFASQYSYCARKLELDEEKINVNGGAIALGHPLGATGTDMILHSSVAAFTVSDFDSTRFLLFAGARCVATLLHEMRRRGPEYRFGIVSMCIGKRAGKKKLFCSFSHHLVVMGRSCSVAGVVRTCSMCSCFFPVEL